jgi:hypothetical protein
MKKKQKKKELKTDKEYLEVKDKTIKDKNKSNKEISEVAVKDHPKDSKEKNDAKDPKEMNEKEEQTDFKPVQEEVKPKKMIEVKPRESYLKDKIGKLQFNNNLLSGINKGIGEQLKSVKNEIYNEKVNVKESPKKLNEYLNKSLDSNSNNILNVNENYNLKNKYKTIKDLKNEKDILSKKLAQIKENQNLIVAKNNSDFIYEQNLNEKMKKEMDEQKSKIISKLERVNEKIKDIIFDDEELKNKKQENLKNFIDNFERDKEIIEIRAKKYLKEKKERNKRIANDLQQVAEKRKKEIEDQDKKEKEKQEKIQIKLKRKAKEIEFKQSKEIGAKALKYKPYIHQKVDGTVKDYLFMKKYDNYIKNESNILKQENLNRKKKMKQVTNEEIKEFNNKMDKKREENQLKTDQKKEKLKEEWNERKKNLPNYVSSFSENGFEDTQIKEEKETKEKRGALIDKQKGYAEEIRYLKQPQVDKELEQKRLNTINNLDPKRFLTDKETLQHKRKGRVLLKKPDPNKPSKFGWELKINTSDNEISIEKKLIKRPKKYLMSMSTDKNNSKLPDIKIDYLQEMKEKSLKEKNLKINSSANTLANNNYAKSSEKKWNRIINDNKKVSFIDSINDAKSRVELLDNQALLSQKLLNLQEPTSNNIELNKKVSNLLIDSIEAKLSLLNKMK